MRHVGMISEVQLKRTEIHANEISEFARFNEHLERITVEFGHTPQQKVSGYGRGYGSGGRGHR